MYLMVDNYDSFVYNLVRYMEELGEQVEVVRNDKITIKRIEEKVESGSYKGIIISPGPKTPKDSGVCREIVEKLGKRVPILGVCLGHQIIGDVFGGTIKKGFCPMHGKVTPIQTNQKGVFQKLPSRYAVTRYHSLIVEKESLPTCLEIDALSEDQVIMGMHHKELPIYGVQFHPEAILTEYGHELLKNYTDLCEKWWETV